MKKKENKVVSWVKNNRKVLYWPLGGAVYLVLVLIIYLTHLSEFLIFLLILPIFPFIFLSTTLFRTGNLFGAAVLFEVTLLLIGFFNNKIKKIRIKILLLTILFIILIFIGSIIGLTGKVSVF